MGWSAPGIKYSSYRFAKGLHGVFKFYELVNRFKELAKRNVVVVVPDNDAVPQVDEQLGMVQQIECRREKSFEPGDPVQCHALHKTICEIWRVCGDPGRKRDLRFTCDAIMGNATYPAEVFPY